MFVTHVIIFILTAISSVSSDFNVSDNDYMLLPPIFHIDPYDKCLQEKKIFCRVALKLFPEKYESKIWKLIESTKKSKQFYNHDELYHVICLNFTGLSTNQSVVKETVLEDYKNKYKNLGLKTTVVAIDCLNLEYRVRFFDIVVLTVILLYLVLILVTTFYDLKSHPSNKFISAFSLWKNLRKLCQIYNQRNSEKLKCIQGIRFYTTVFIIFCHTFCSYAGGHIADTKYLEDFSKNIFRHSLRNLFVFLVQTFFLVSAWLLSYNTFKVLYKAKQKDFFRYIWLTFLNRYLRIIPPVILMVSIGTSIWIYGFFKGPVKFYTDEEYERCQKTWWVVFLFISNHYQQNDMCYITNWYLSADMQLYAISVIFLVIMIAFKKFKYFIMLVCLFMGIIIPTVISFIYNLDVIYRITPENFKHNKFRTFETNAIYTSTYANMATYMLGLIFGYVYYCLEDKPIFTKKYLVLLWYILFIGLPLSVILIATFEYEGITACILTGILKPLYALGIGIGILGMSQQVGGVLKSVCEWRPAIFLGNVTYCTYVVHFGIVFSRTALTLKPLPVSDYVLFTSLLRDIFWSFICGLLLHLLVELPAAELQKLFVPKFTIHNSKQKKNM